MFIETKTKFGILDWEPLDWINFDDYFFELYQDRNDLEMNCEHLKMLPPFIQARSIDILKQNLTAIQNNKQPIIMVGDCAEEFYHANASITKSKINFLDSISSIISSYSYDSILLARMAGQFAKPRSQKTETKNGITLPSYFGDMFNGKIFNECVRQIRAVRLLEAYDASCRIVNHVEACLQNCDKLTKDKLFFCHEAYNLFYDGSLTRKVNGIYYNLSTHMPWLGMRTVGSTSHVRFLSGIANPIGIKIGPLIDVQWLVQLLNTLNPLNEAGKIILITRLGYKEVHNVLPYLITTIQKYKMKVIWVCDPMHGNNEVTDNNFKTRHLDNILCEIQGTINVHFQNGSYMNGIHLETTYEDVTECTGGNVTNADLHRNYTSAVDPRLNPVQTNLVLKYYLNMLEAC
jgi:3-deoxy-7-phosphoheptulonate synthase